MRNLLLLTLLSTFIYPNFIGLNNGARSLGMGDAFTALSDEPTAIFYNPAGLARANMFLWIGPNQLEQSHPLELSKIAGYRWYPRLLKSSLG